MCDRLKEAGIEEFSQLRLRFRPGRNPRLNGDWRPGGMVPAIVLESGQRVLDDMRWGLIPAHSQSEYLEYSTHNARSERLAEAPTYRGAWRRGQRCLLPAAEFYERGRAFRLEGGGLMLLAALWDEWKNPIGGTLRSCTMITTSPNDLVARVHNRMPAIISSDDIGRWLGEAPATEAELKDLLRPFPADLMAMAMPASTRAPKAARTTAASAQGSLF